MWRKRKLGTQFQKSQERNRSSATSVVMWGNMLRLWRRAQLQGWAALENNPTEIRLDANAGGVSSLSLTNTNQASRQITRLDRHDDLWPEQTASQVMTFYHMCHELDPVSLHFWVEDTKVKLSTLASWLEERCICFCLSVCVNFTSRVKQSIRRCFSVISILPEVLMAIFNLARNEVPFILSRRSHHVLPVNGS